MSHYAWRREFVGDIAEAAGENRKTYTIFPNNQDNESLKKAVVNGLNLVVDILNGCFNGKPVLIRSLRLSRNSSV